MHWSQRQQQRQEQRQQQPQQQQAPQLPSELAAANDTVDVLEACGSHPQQSQWRHIWELANASYCGVGLCLDHKAPRLADIVLTASGGTEEGYAAVKRHLGICG